MTTIDRRQALGFATGAAATLAVPAGARRVSNGRFLWGAATAGYQIEGNAPATDIWLLEHMTPTIFAEPSVCLQGLPAGSDRSISGKPIGLAF